MTFQVHHHTIHGLGMEERKAKDLDSLLAKLPKRLQNWFLISNEDGNEFFPNT